MIESQANNAGTGRSDQPLSPATDAQLDQRAPRSEGAPAEAQTIEGVRGGRLTSLRRFFWLDDKIAELLRAGSWMDPSTWPELEIVRQTRDGVQALCDEDANGSAVAILGRVEVILLIRVLMRRHGLSCSSGHMTEQDWATGEQVPEIREMLSRLTINEVAAVKACLGTEAEMSLVGLDPNQRQHVARGLQRAAEILMEPIDRDVEQVRKVQTMRWIRVGTAATLILCLLGAVGAVIGVLTRKPNLALNRPAKASSYLANEYVPKHWSIDATRVVDGITTGLGFCTDFEANPFLVIDLGKPQSFNKVVVYNRTDCCQERAVPLFLETSDDGTSYRVLAERRETFTTWTADDLHAKGRYVRLRVSGSAFFHLAEVEIY